MTSSLLISGILMVLLSATAPAWAQLEPRDLTVCEGVTCQTLFDSICSAGGFKITLTYYHHETGPEGAVTYRYEICDAHLTDCPVPLIDFYELNHFDVTFPERGTSCLPAGTIVTGTCECKDESSFGCSVSSDVLIGDGSCFTESSPVARCDINDLQPGECIVMTVIFIGDHPDLVLGPAVVVDKAGDYCTSSCIAGPSCTPCEEGPGGPECLTRTHGFWATHPQIADLFDPVTVCGVVVDGHNEGECSTSEALCSSAKDNKDNPPYLSLVTQLTAAKLNLNATAALIQGATCASWEYGGKSIQQWINDCEISSCDACKAGKHPISSSGCIEALTAFNESQETGFDVTPAPFDRPGPADPGQCQDARGNGKYIGLDGGLSCTPPPL